MNVCPCLGGLLSVDLCNPCVFSNHLPWWLTPISENMRGFQLFNHGCFKIEPSFSCGLFKSDPTVVAIVSTIWHVTEIFWLHRNALPFCIGLGNLKSRISTSYLQILGTPKVLAPRSFSGTSHHSQTNMNMLVCLCQYQWPFQEPKLEVPTIYKAYIRPM